MELKEFALSEFRAAGWVDEHGNFDDDMQELMCTQILELLDVFSSHGHSGFSANYALSLFDRLAKFKPVAPLTGHDDEWINVAEYSGGPLWQNKRCSSVFKDEKECWDIDARVFWEWSKREDGSLFKSYFTNSDSRIAVSFPYSKPAMPEYVFRPSEEFPNELP